MKSQDIVILLKLISLQNSEKYSEKPFKNPSFSNSKGWQGWEIEADNDWEEANQQGYKIFQNKESYTVRGLAAALGVSKSEVNTSIKRSVSAGLAIYDRVTGYPKVNRKALLDFIIYGLKYVFPAKPGEIVRGIPTSFAAPVLQREVMTAGEFIHVWPDAKGKRKGQLVPPLFKSVPFAVKKDPWLYELLALVDAIRLGNSRETKVAILRMKERFGEDE